MNLLDPGVALRPFICACALILGAPSAAWAAPAPPRPTAALRATMSRLIKHVVIIMQENRGFNYMFNGYPGATTFSKGRNSKGQTIRLKPVSLAARYDMAHFSADMFRACDGSPPGENCRMDGFDQERASGSVPPNPQYGYAPHSEVQPYFEMAGQFVLGDMMFTSNLDASFVSHQYIIAGQANHEVDLPRITWGCGGASNAIGTLNADRTYGPTQSPCQDYQTLGDELTNKSLGWRYYAAPSDDVGFIWAAYQAVSHDFYGPAWKHTMTPSSRVLTDIAAGTLESVTWVTPDWVNADHPGNASTTGPQWVASIVNAVGRSPFWRSSAIFILWDEWGGWYDGVPPPYVDYDGLGFRVPLLIVSPYARAGRVTHVQYEHGSILRFIEDTFGLPQLAASDTRANDPASDPNAFDFAASPRPYPATATALGPSFFVEQPPSNRPADDD